MVDVVHGLEHNSEASLAEQSHGLEVAVVPPAVLRPWAGRGLLLGRVAVHLDHHLTTYIQVNTPLTLVDSQNMFKRYECKRGDWQAIADATLTLANFANSSIPD